jgi:transposase
MDQVHVIRHKVLVEGLSRREVATEMGVSRNTVRKYVEQSEPVFPKVERGRPVLERVRPRLDALIEDWGGRTTRKQRLTATRLHRQLRDEGFEVGVTTVRGYFREKKRECAETFIPLVHRVGDEAQVDFFEVTVELDGVRCKRWMFVLRLMYSGRDFAWLYEHCDQVSFFDGHVRAFAHFGGVPARCIYDNLSPAVRKVLFPGRKLTVRFMALVSHYLFEPCFARPGTGHDKGGIEGRGKVIRYQHLVPIPRGAALKEVAAELLANLDAQTLTKKDAEGRTVAERFAEEQPQLRALPERPFEPRRVVLLQVDRKALVRFGGAVYSLPTHWKQLEVTAYVGPIDIRFICREEVRVRERVGRRERNIKYRDYFAELRRKPQAVRQVAPELLEEMSAPFGELWRLLELSHGGREAGRIFAKVLGAVVEHGESAVADALKKALDGGHRHLLELSSIIRSPLPETIEVPEPLRDYVVEAAKATDFDWLLEEGAP